MRLVWCTDPHLNFLPEGGAKAFGQGVLQDYPDLDGVLLSGDIGEFPNFLPLLDDFQKGLGKPVWYILGNHDAYQGSIAGMKAKAHAHTNPMTRYLVKEKLVELTPGIEGLDPSVALVGHDGWYDARNGDPKRSNVILSDFHWIKEFRGKWENAIIAVARMVADAAAAEALTLLEAAVAKGYKRIVFATHVPPYAQSAWHAGQMSDKNWLPWMSAQSMGDTIDRVANANPDVFFTVLCGHTHGAGRYQRQENVEVLTGHAEYRAPRVCGDFTFP
jgi:Icc protein